MNSRGFAIFSAAALIALMVWVASRPGTPPAPAVTKATEKSVPAVPAPVIAPENPKPAEPSAPVPPVPPPAAPMLPPQESTPAVRRDFSNPLVPSSVPGDMPATPSNKDAAVEADIDKITLMLRDYRTIAGENPVGTNAEIMKSIMGGNPKGAMLGPPEGQHLNENDELVDRWGSPYFFHQLTKDLMEIHSAGPDRKMGTPDDIVGK